MRSLKLLFLLGSLFTGNVFAGDVVHVMDPWLREGPPNARVLAAFMTLHNGGKESVHLKAASSTDFGTIELHRTVMENGMARMKPQQEIVVEAGKMVQLKPGDYHLMLFQAKKSFRAGDKLTITLDFGRHGKQDVVFTVRKGGSGGMHMHEHQH